VFSTVLLYKSDVSLQFFLLHPFVCGMRFCGVAAGVIFLKCLNVVVLLDFVPPTFEKEGMI
jgi:hypothetical protein